MRAWLLTLPFVIALLPAQSPQLTTIAVDATRNFVQSSYGGYEPVPLGMVTFPLVVENPWSLFGSYLRVDRVGDQLSLEQGVLGMGSIHGTWAKGNLVTTVSMPLPARVALDVAFDAQRSLWTTYFTSAAEIDVGANGTAEFASSYPTLALPTRLEILVDARGTPVRWAVDSGGTQGGAPALSISRLELAFAATVQEIAYGPSCEGELGCQLVPGQPFARTFVASLPNAATHAWLFGGDQQRNIAVPGVTCPLLCDPVVVQAVPLQPGSNDRQMAVLDTVFPPLPGQVWFVQGAALSGGFLVGTNGVRVQT